MSYWNGNHWVSEPSEARAAPKRSRRLLSATLEASLIVLLMFGLIAGTALAAKGGKGGGGKPGSGGDTTSSLTLRMVVDQSADGGPNWNDQVTFDTSTSATTRPWVLLNCYQSGAWVSTSTAGYFPEYPWAPNFTLASGGWTSGAADCIATLYMTTSNGRSKNLATLTFAVGA